MDTPLKYNKKVMCKDEVALLIDLIQSNPILTSKETNASTNKSKEDRWTSVTSTYNAKTGSIPRTKEQLKLKFDNLKKAARKRSQKIRMNNLKTGGGKPDFIAPDEILDRVTGLMGSTCTGFVVPFGGDGVGSLIMLDAADDMDLSDGYNLNEGVGSNDARPNIPDDVEVLNEIPIQGTQGRKRKVAAEITNNFFGTPMSDQLKTTKKGKKKEDNDGRLARNLAIAKYYEKKQKN